ncbi:MAG TPA: hypothetical protein VKB54_01020 [Solirubrobacteraceae bacterium]|nr:hypothetical protein [Solirubrobacteraceae bacterium]
MSAHLRVYRFDPGAVFEGGLVGAVERMQLEGGVTLLDALFVSHDEASGEFAAVDLASGRAGGTFAAMLDFRLDPGRRQAITERTLAEHRDGVPRALIEEIAATLEAGAAIFAVLHTGGAPTTLEEAVERCRGRPIAEEPVEAIVLADVGPRVSAAAASAASG